MSGLEALVRVNFIDFIFHFPLYVRPSFVRRDKRENCIPPRLTSGVLKCYIEIAPTVKPVINYCSEVIL
jgi:hypothetical protein